jgi:type 1 glutamine amidotransferase
MLSSFTLMKHLWILLVSSLLLAAAASAADTKVVLIAGRPSHPPGMHEFRAGCLLFQKCLAGVPGLRVEVYSNGWPTVTVEGKPVDDNHVFTNAAAVVIYCDGGSGHPAIQPERMKVIDELAARGVGLGFAHYAVEVPVGEPAAAMQRWIGGNYEDHYSVNPMWSPDYAVLPAHPVTRGVKPFRNKDEWYFNMRWGANTNHLTPILVATPSDKVRQGPYVWPAGPYPHIIAESGRPEVMMWAFERTDGGRGFGFTGGHTHANWRDPNQRKIFLNAILWLARKEVPADGVTSAVTDEDMTQNLDPKAK